MQSLITGLVDNVHKNYGIYLLQGKYGKIYLEIGWLKTAFSSTNKIYTYERNAQAVMIR